MQWLTWENVGVDRMASAWLIVRFIDGAAQFAFIPERSKPGISEAEPFDIPGARLSHRHGQSTFHTILDEYCLQDPILERLAHLVDEADTLQEVSWEPAAVGLDWVCRGLRKICQNDTEALQKGYAVFEGLYAYLGEEGHTPYNRPPTLAESQEPS